MVSMVLMVSTSVCGTDRIGSNPFRHPLIQRKLFNKLKIYWRVMLDGDSGCLLSNAFG